MESFHTKYPIEKFQPIRLIVLKFLEAHAIK